MQKILLGIAIVLLGLVTSCTKKPQSLTEQLEEKTKEYSKAPEEIKRDLKSGVDQLRETKLHVTALREGVKLPDFPIRTSNGSLVPIKTLYSQNAIVLKFYRGGWCPYCQLELKAYETLKEKFEEKGAKIVALTPDTYQEIRKTKDELGLSFTIYSDQNNEIAKQLGIAFKVDNKTLEHYKTFGINLEQAHGNNLGELPMPGTYVVDKNGYIRFAFIDPDYTQRAEPAKVLKVVELL